MLKLFLVPDCKCVFLSCNIGHFKVWACRGWLSFAESFKHCLEELQFLPLHVLTSYFIHRGCCPPVWQYNRHHLDFLETERERVTKLILIMLIIIMMMLVLRCKLIINNNDRIAGSRCIKSKLTGKGKLTWGSLETHVTLKLFQEKNYFGKKWSAMYIMLTV